MDQYLAVNTMPAMLPVQVMDKYSFTPGICANTMPFMLPVQVRDTDSLTRAFALIICQLCCLYMQEVQTV